MLIHSTAFFVMILPAALGVFSLPRQARKTKKEIVLEKKSLKSWILSFGLILGVPGYYLLKGAEKIDVYDRAVFLDLVGVPFFSWAFASVFWAGVFLAILGFVVAVLSKKIAKVKK